MTEAEETLKAILDTINELDEVTKAKVMYEAAKLREWIGKTGGTAILAMALVGAEQAAEE